MYWARLADEKGLPPVVLNRLVPELTRRMIANIFATDIEDWVALTRAMKLTGEEFRQGKIPVPQWTQAAADPVAPREHTAVQEQTQASAVPALHP